MQQTQRIKIQKHKKEKRKHNYTDPIQQQHKNTQ